MDFCHVIYHMVIFCNNGLYSPISQQQINFSFSREVHKLILYDDSLGEFLSGISDLEDNVIDYP